MNLSGQGCDSWLGPEEREPLGRMDALVCCRACGITQNLHWNWTFPIEDRSEKQPQVSCEAPSKLCN